MEVEPATTDSRQELLQRYLEPSQKIKSYDLVKRGDSQSKTTSQVPSVLMDIDSD